MSPSEVEHTPTAASPETREETIARVEQNMKVGAESQHEPGGADPTSRRHVGRRSLLRAYVIGLGIAIPVAIIIFLVGGSIGLALGIAGAVLIGGGVVVALVGAENEDGRIDDDVEKVASESG